mmetsp:Transcript_134513/g.374895  ORF Transcript_134513/g.374895 Transcript_134513/m.374895 type:complete len:204 (-) Transcript_134513:4-615(-)
MTPCTKWHAKSLLRRSFRGSRRCSRLGCGPCSKTCCSAWTARALTCSSSCELTSSSSSSGTGVGAQEDVDGQLAMACVNSAGHDSRSFSKTLRSASRARALAPSRNVLWSPTAGRAAAGSPSSSSQTSTNSSGSPRVKPGNASSGASAKRNGPMSGPVPSCSGRSSSSPQVSTRSSSACGANQPRMSRPGPDTRRAGSPRASR